MTKTKKSILLFAAGSLLATTLCAAPGGGGPGGGGGGMTPGGGGNQPDAPGGSSGTFTYDTFLTDATTANGTISYGGVWTGYVADTTSLIAPSTVTALVAGVCAGNKSVVTLDLSSATALTSIPPAAFAKCTALTTVILPASVTEIGDGAFEGCAALASLTAPGVTTVGRHAFRGCTGLAALPAAATSFGDFAFAQSGLASVDLADATLGIGVCAECPALATATAPNAIPDATFALCTNLTALTSDCSSLGTAALAGVPFEDSLTLPSSVALGDYALAANESPQALTLAYDGATIPTTNTTTFLGRTLVASYTPADGAVCRVEAKPLVDWLEENAASASVTQPSSYASADLRTWLADTDNLTSFLYADSLAADSSFAALTVSGTSFVVSDQDATTAGVVTATLQTCDDLAEGDWQDVSNDALSDGVFTPGTDAAFARILYTIPW